ncbi:MAG: hypothetical protein LC795_14130 [Acidobacteria bacterium]|nr:hypothetical protein [Acidobacteriota bacterium]MCA1620417.1 hypothetical protein [Acidobacteriota bacterium]
MGTLKGRTFFQGGRRLLLSLLLLSATAPAAAGRQAAPKLDWREFTSEAGGFSVKFPGEPRLSRPQMERGPLTLARNLHEVTVGDYNFAMDYVDMPAGFDPELALEGGISGLSNHALARGGRVLTNGKAMSGACEGREAVVSVPSGSGRTGFMQARAFYSGQRYYMIFFGAGDDHPAARAVARTYLDSLVIRDACRAPRLPAAAPPAAVARSTVEGRPDAATGWRLIESAEHGFSVLMPGAARRESAQAQVQPFPVFHHEYVHESGMRGRVQLYATPRRAYIFLAITRGRGPAGAADLERFFSSVRVSPR